MSTENQDHLLRELDWLKAEHIINGWTHRAYMFLISSANEREQLDQIALDLAEIRGPLKMLRR